ncbi:CarD family transcriptional regulator [Bartonella sp. DGB1]|uniref:CarD family transcriptional regulator n=1 Tax=Bartonella sp. DGB1 TaxID=3239807 RepID=UPI003525C924
MSAVTKVTHSSSFEANEYIVYPAHGVGQITAIEKQSVVGHELELFVIHFEKDKMDVKVPVLKALSSGMRKLADDKEIKRALKVLTGRSRIKKTMWSRRAQEYDSKINSGSLTTVAEVVRDLYRTETQNEQSYSEKQIYEVAFSRMMQEISAVYDITMDEAKKLIEDNLTVEDETL